MRRSVVVLGLLLSVTGPLRAQSGYYVGSDGLGPELGAVLRLGARVTFEPGVYANIDNYHRSQDSLTDVGHGFSTGLVGQLRWTRRVDGAVSTAFGVEGAVGKTWLHTSDTELLGGSSTYSSSTSWHPMEYLAGAIGGVEVRVSERVRVDFEYHLWWRTERGTQTQSDSFGYPAYTSTGPYRYSEIWNTVAWRLRVLGAPAHHGN